MHLFQINCLVKLILKTIKILSNNDKLIFELNLSVYPYNNQCSSEIESSFELKY